VLRNSRPARPKIGRERTGIGRSGAQAIEDRPPGWIGDGAEGICLGSYPGHNV
jgi:hypothetical protein